MTSKKIIFVLVLSFISVLAAGWVTLRAWPESDGNVLASVVRVTETKYYICEDDTLRQFTFSADGFCPNDIWLYPSNKGRVITAISDTMQCAIDTMKPRDFIEKEIDTLSVQRRKLYHANEELRYYLRVHGVQDEGYDIIAKYSTKLKKKLDSINNSISRLSKIAEKKEIRIKQIVNYVAYYQGFSTIRQKVPLKYIKSSKGREYKLLSTVDEKKMPYINSINILPFNVAIDDSIVGVSTSRKYISIPVVLCNSGAPLFSERGTFVGMKLKHRIVLRNELRTFINLAE